MYKPSSSTKKATADFVPKKRGIVPSANSAFKRTVSSFTPAKRQRKDPVPVRKRQSLADIVRQFDEEDEAGGPCAGPCQLPRDTSWCRDCRYPRDLTGSGR